MVVVRDLEASLRFYRDGTGLDGIGLDGIGLDGIGLDGIGLDLLQDRHVEGDWPDLFDAPTFTPVHGRSVLRCSGRANHRDPVTPPHLSGGKPGSGPPPGGNFSSGLTWASELERCQPTQPKGDPP